jgi:hypothetical protein
MRRRFRSASGRGGGHPRAAEGRRNIATSVSFSSSPWWTRFELWWLLPRKRRFAGPSTRCGGSMRPPALGATKVFRVTPHAVATLGLWHTMSNRTASFSA